MKKILIILLTVIIGIVVFLISFYFLGDASFEKKSSPIEKTMWINIEQKENYKKETVLSFDKSFVYYFYEYENGELIRDFSFGGRYKINLPVIIINRYTGVANDSCLLLGDSIVFFEESNKNDSAVYRKLEGFERFKYFYSH